MSALKDIRQYLEANEVTLETVHEAIEGLREDIAARDTQTSKALVDIQRFLAIADANQSLLNDRLTVLQDSVIEGFRKLGARVTAVEDKEEPHRDDE